MKKVKETDEMQELRDEIATLESVNSIYNRQILDPNRDMSLLSLIRLERGIKKEIQTLTVRLHTLENRMVEMGQATPHSRIQTVRKNTNQYSK